MQAGRLKDLAALADTPAAIVPDVAGPVLRHRPFLFFLVARTASSLAFQMQAVAIGWQVYAHTNSALALGLVGLAEFLPSLLLAFVAGHVADRFDRRVIVQMCQAVQAAAMAWLAVASLHGGPRTGLIFFAVGVIGSAGAFSTPARQALLPAIVPGARLPQAMAVSSSAFQTATICGPAVGGLIYAVSPGAVYLASALLVALSFVLMGMVRVAAVARVREPFSLASVFAGVHYIRSRPVLLGAISLDLFAVLLGGATALLPIFARDVLAVAPWGLGALRSAPAVGALGMSLLMGWRPLGGRAGRTMFLAVGVFGVATIVFAFSRSLWLSMAALVVLGAADAVSVVIRGALVQLQTPDAMRGRVNAVYFIFIGSSNELGEFESGVTANWFGAVRAAAIGGIGTLLVALVWMRAFPSLARYDRLQAAA